MKGGPMPYKVVIIDDNRYAAEMLAKTIDWGLLGCAVASVAFDGLSGRQAIVAAKPDIILSDINMPGMDGLRMIELVREILPEAKVIFISAYDQFDYALRALRVGAFDYVLKPVDRKKLTETVMKAVHLIEADRAFFAHTQVSGSAAGRDASLLETAAGKSAAGYGAAGHGAAGHGAAGHGAAGYGASGRVAALTLILNNLMLTDDRIRSLLERENLVFSSFFAMATEATEIYDQSVLSALLSENGASDSALTVSLYLSNRLIIFFFLREEVDSVPRDLVVDTVKCLSGRGMRIRHVSVSRLHIAAPELPAAYCEVLDLPGELCPDRDEAVYSFAENRFGHIAGRSFADISLLVDATCERLIERREDPEEVIREFTASLSRLTNRDPLIMKFYFIDFCVRFIKARVAASSVDMSGFVDETANQLKQLADMTLAQRILSVFVKQVSESLCPPGPKSSLLANNILLYIDLHASERLSLDSLAAHFAVSPTYVSALVKKQTGKKYSECVIDARMTLAKNLLLDPRYRINEVSEAVGYKNYVTFYNVFTKREGVTPRDYRSSLRDGR